VQEQIAVAEQRRIEQAEATRKIRRSVSGPSRTRTNFKICQADIGAVSTRSPNFSKATSLQWHNGSVVHADDTALANKKLIRVLFFGALVSPCRKFTPELVDYYNRVAAQHPEFEIVFYSFDKSPFAFETYIRRGK